MSGKSSSTRLIGGPENVYRYHVFAVNYHNIESTNSKNLSYKLGLNQFADLTNEEFKSIYMGFNGKAVNSTRKFGAPQKVEGTPASPLIGDKRALSPLSRTKANADPAGLSPPLALLKVTTSSPLASSSPSLSKSSLTAPVATTATWVATVVLWTTPSSTLKLTV